MAVLYCAIIFGTVLAVVSSFVLTNEDPVIPSQHLYDDNSVLRILPNNEKQIIQCPKGTSLDKTSVTCKFEGTSSTVNTPSSEVCSGRTGDFTNPENCRTYISCGAAGAFTVACPANLLFNEATDRCDWPRQAGCCEYIENNSSRLLQNSS